MTTDELLKDYLQKMTERQRAEDEGVKSALGSLAAQVQLLGLKMDSQASLQSERFSGLAARVDKLEKNDETTGSHNIETLNKQLADAKAGEKRIMGYVIAGAGSLLLMGLSGAGAVVWFLISKGTR